MESVIAKFSCWTVTDSPVMESTSVYLSAVTSGSEENKAFSKYTPAASLNITISHETPASGFFEQGKEYFLTFTKAE